MTAEGIGNAIFKVQDIYTGTLDGSGKVVQGLAGARITVQNELVTTIESTLTTDALGEAFFQDLPAGRYKVRVTAGGPGNSFARARSARGLHLKSRLPTNPGTD